MKPLAIFITVLLAAMCLNTAAAQTLSIGTAEWHPWQILENGRLKGISPDILQEVSKRAGLEMNIRWLPHKRLMMAFNHGTVDMEPSVNPAWRESTRAISIYTRPYYLTGDIILVRKESGLHGESVRDFYGLKLGCGLGYYYPEGFQEVFAVGHIRREDNPAAEANLKKLTLNRLDGIIVDRIQARYLMNKLKLDRADFSTAYAFKPSPLCLRLRHERKDLLPVLNAALASMQADGTVDRIVESYLK